MRIRFNFNMQHHFYVFVAGIATVYYRFRYRRVFI